MENVQWHFMGNWMYGAQAANSASGEGLGDDNMGMFNMPMTAGGLGNSADTLGGINGWLFSSSAPDSAVELMMHYVSKEIQNEDAAKVLTFQLLKVQMQQLTNPLLAASCKKYSKF